jgi:hypothetical protein
MEVLWEAGGERGGEGIEEGGREEGGGEEGEEGVGEGGSSSVAASWNDNLSCREANR